METLAYHIVNFVVNVVGGWGYGGIIALMAIESACIPLPSEIIMPFAGYLVFLGKMNLQAAGWAGAVGCLVGSWIAYLVGAYGGIPFLLKYGRYVFITFHELDRARYWFNRFGDKAIFFSRLMPVIRTFISLPAGIGKMNPLKFSIYTLVGSYPWCLALAYGGKKLGENWQEIRDYFHRVDVVVISILILLIVFWVAIHLKRKKLLN